MNANTAATNPENTYWTGRGRYQDVYKKLWKNVPTFGSCDPSLPKLEKLRVISVAYYDLYNNGACNRAMDVYGIVGFIPHDCAEFACDEVDHLPTKSFDEVALLMEAEVDKVICEALEEYEYRRANPVIRSTEFERAACRDIMHVAYARIENGATISEAFEWAEEEYDQLLKGEFPRIEEVQDALDFGRENEDAG